MTEEIEQIPVHFATLEQLFGAETRDEFQAKGVVASQGFSNGKTLDNQMESYRAALREQAHKLGANMVANVQYFQSSQESNTLCTFIGQAYYRAPK